LPYLVDGYNVYHAARKMAEQWSHITTLTLCQWIARDMQSLKDRAIVVFDGKKLRGQPTEVKPAGFVEILHSGPKQDADTALEDLIQQNTAPRRLTVVSSDNRLRKAARRRRCKLLKAPQYLEELIRRQQTPPRRETEPIQKRLGLAEGELPEWLERFGLSKDNPDENERSVGKIK
jgi:predicted RNA-binding protein with PIN domain